MRGLGAGGGGEAQEGQDEGEAMHASRVAAAPAPGNEQPLTTPVPPRPGGDGSILPRSVAPCNGDRVAPDTRGTNNLTTIAY